MALSARRLKLTVQYDGTDFHGWQRQHELRTAQGTLEDACERLFGAQVEVAGASRTDRGVHAEGQVASLDCCHPIPTGNIALALNGFLPSDLRVVAVSEVGGDFHARFSALAKHYRYLIDVHRFVRVLWSRYALYSAFELNLDAMQNAARHFVGEHDFAAFQCATDQGPVSTVRQMHRLSISPSDGFIEIDIWGNGFLYKMVRTMVGTLLEVGRGAWSDERVVAAISSCDRREAGPTAPPHGLRLLRVYYDESDLRADC